MRTRTWTLAAVAVLSCACATTRLTVRRVADETEPAGIRYSLPKPFLLVTPNTNGDGSFKAEVIYLADESSTYAIDASTRRGKFSLDVTVKEGLLSKVAWTRTDATVAAENVRVSGELLKSELERRNKEDEERREKNKAAQKAAEDELKKLRAELEVQRLEVELAQAEVDSAADALKTEKSEASRAALRAAELKLTQATLRRDAAERHVEAARSTVESLGGTFNEPTTGGAPAKMTDRAKFWSPVLYAIVDDGKTVNLRAVPWDDAKRKQFPFETAAAPKEPKPAAAQPTPVGGTSMSTAWPAVANTHTIDLEFNAPLVSVDSTQRRLSRRQPNGSPDPIPDRPFNPVLDVANKKLVHVTFTRSLDAGTYIVFFPFKYDKETDGSVSVTIEVNR